MKAGRFLFLVVLSLSAGTAFAQGEDHNVRPAPGLYAPATRPELVAGTAPADTTRFLNTISTCMLERGGDSIPTPSPSAASQPAALALGRGVPTTGLYR